MKNYRIDSKIIIGLCFCLIILTLINFFTGIINPILSGSSHLLCFTGFAATIWVTVTMEKERKKKIRN